MIRYALVCVNGHEFESWFPSGAAHDDQTKRSLIMCPLCNTPHVSKAIMAPNVARAAVAPQQAGALVDHNVRALRRIAGVLRARIMEYTTDVGACFPEEARKIHAGEADDRPIRGQASPDEARALLEDGIIIMPLPVLPDDHH